MKILVVFGTRPEAIKLAPVILAGLRTNNKYSPFPEEINRILTSHIADLHFAPTKWAAKNLIKEGIPKSRIFVTGNTVIDALHIVQKKIYNHRNQPASAEMSQCLVRKPEKGAQDSRCWFEGVHDPPGSLSERAPSPLGQNFPLCKRGMKGDFNTIKRCHPEFISGSQLPII
jgi:hypothetical protein